MSSNFKEELQEALASIPGLENLNINVNINVEDIRVQVEQRAEGGGQINRNVGMNANQGGQNARDNSQTANTESQFADGNGRSGIAGQGNDELGGQQGLKIRDSEIRRSRIRSVSEQTQGAAAAPLTEGEAPVENQLPRFRSLNNSR